MKRLLLLLVMFLVTVQLLILPAAANGTNITVTTLPATNIGVSTATLNATITNTVQRTIDVYFDYGTAPGQYTGKTPTVTYTGVNSITAQANLTGLIVCQNYYARAVISFPDPALQYGNEITFSTPGCPVKRLGQNTIPGTETPFTSGPVQMSNIVVQSAAIATPKVAPGQQVDITASVANNGGSNGDTKVTLYVNGQEVESKGVTVSSGQTTPVHFTVSRNEPGTYSVYVGGVSAGNFTVDLFTNNDILIYGLIALVTLGIAGALYLVTKKRSA